VLIAGLAAWAFASARRRRRDNATGDPQLAELQRALRRTGMALTASTTLHEIEERFTGDPDAAAYVRALRERRYADASAGPTTAQRRAMRRALGARSGVFARLRAFRALPPRIVRRPAVAQAPHRDVPARVP